MTNPCCLLTLLSFIALLTSSAVAQNPPPPANSGAAAITAQGSGWTFFSPSGITVASTGINPLGAIAGKPFSAEQVTDSVQTLADGTHITRTSQKTLLYRDSEGRTRTEHIFIPPPGAAMVSGPSLIQIADPVAGVRYIVNQRDHTAQRMLYGPAAMRNRPAVPAATPSPNSPLTGAQLPSSVVRSGSMGAVISPSAPPSSRPHPDMSHESLGTRNIDGVIADGSRTTITYPESFIGNDRPITVVTETWTSPELKMVVLSKTSDPRSGDTTIRLNNVSQTEPDPALFQVPADYTITEMPQSPAAAIINK